MTQRITLTIASALILLSACQQDQTQAYTANPSQYAPFSCEQLRVKMDARRATIESANDTSSNMTTANTAGLAVGLLVSPVIGAAIAADAQSRQNKSESQAQQAKAELQAMTIAGSQKGCW